MKVKIYIPIFILLFHNYKRVTKKALFKNVLRFDLFYNIFRIARMIGKHHCNALMQKQRVFQLNCFYQLKICIADDYILFHALLSLVLENHKRSIMTFFQFSAKIQQYKRPLNPNYMVQFRNAFLRIMQRIVTYPLHLFQFF